jgi:hypothetical protein
MSQAIDIALVTQRRGTFAVHILERTGVDMNKQWLETLRANLKETRERQDADAERVAAFWDKSRDPRLWRKHSGWKH